MLDNLRDPGNAGTIIRSADAAGVGAVVLSGDCVDPFNPKTLRASAGSVFHVSVIDGVAERQRSLSCASTAFVPTPRCVDGATSYLDVRLARPLRQSSSVTSRRDWVRPRWRSATNE